MTSLNRWLVVLMLEYIDCRVFSYFFLTCVLVCFLYIERLVVVVANGGSELAIFIGMRSFGLLLNVLNHYRN